MTITKVNSFAVNTTPPKSYDPSLRGSLGQEDALRLINYVEQSLTSASYPLDWYIQLEMVNEKHDKYYIVGHDSVGYYIQYGRNTASYQAMPKGHLQGKRCEHTSTKSIAYKLSEKMQKGYYLNTRVSSQENAFSDLFLSVVNEVDLADGNLHTVDLSGVSAMFKVVKSLRYMQGAYKGYNKDAAYVMTVPTPVVEAYLKGGV